MKRDFFINIESLSSGSSLSLTEVINEIYFDEQGLIPVITQDANTKSVLMFAWMNQLSLEKTLLSKRMTYWSRSRQQLWLKGETSGHTQELVSMAIDCDGDAILCEVNQTGGACHTGRADCFYLKIDIESNQVIID